MNRTFVALAFGAALALMVPACGQDEPEGASPSDEPPTSFSMDELQLVDVEVSKPPPNLKVDKSQLPEDMQTFSEMGGASPDQQNCINGAMKQALDKDPSLAQKAGKRFSLAGSAIAVCDAGTLFTEQFVGGLTPEGSGSQISDVQRQCLADAFKADPKGTGKVISSVLSGVFGNTAALKDGLAPFESKCGVDLDQSGS